MENKYRYFIGIDPGLTGAVCVLNDTGEIVDIFNHDVIDGYIDYDSIIRNKWFVGQSYIGIEKAFQKQFQKGTEKIWRNYERLFLAYLPDIEIRPQEWKKTLDIPKGLNKKESIQYQLQHICPKDYDWYKTTKTGKKSIQLDDGKIDAYCIAKYLYLQNKV